MDWQALTKAAEKQDCDKDLPERAWRLQMLLRVLDGTQYDHLPHPFDHEKNDTTGEYVPIRRRRPSVRYGVCRIVVEDAIALLFSEGHFPGFEADNDATVEALEALGKHCRLNETMIEAATRGSVGSVAVLFRALSGKPFFDVLDTPCLTPEWDMADPDRLLRVTEKYKVDAKTLAEMGYPVKPEDGKHWFQRAWDETAEIWYVPWPISKPKDYVPQVDAERTVTHGMGFCPVVWVRNLPGGKRPDGVCTFAPALDTAIEIDYQLSQVGRGLKYSSDPTLLIKEPALDGEKVIKDPGNALIVSESGDAKMLEIGGTAAGAVIEYVRALREFALESMHGNRAAAEKLSAAQSGRALELMNQGLLWLADKLRISYGEGALLALARMVCAASQKLEKGLLIGDKVRKDLNAAGLSLNWPAWYPPTPDEKQAEANTLSTLKAAGLMSRERAVLTLAPTYDIEDVTAEVAAILADEAAQDKRLAEQAAQTQARENVAA